MPGQQGDGEKFVRTCPDASAHESSVLARGCGEVRVSTEKGESPMGED
jgi:hypothetical protein